MNNGQKQNNTLKGEKEMKNLNKKATRIFTKLRAEMTENGTHVKIKNNDTYMAVIVEYIGSNFMGDLISVAHYFEQNGDLMADPEMVFLVSKVDGNIYPFSFLQHSLGVNNVAVELDGERVLVRAKMQRDITRFANEWMGNIKEQQF